jgi:hypothetical protein
MRWFGWTLVVCVRERVKRGKHRTEVTEATEGDLGWWNKCTLVKDRWLRCGNTPKGKASHRGYGGHRGRFGLVDKCTWVKIVGSGARTRQKGKASRRGHGGHRGRFGLVDECTWVKIVGSHAGTRQRGKHRTEVTEATEGDLGWWTNALGSRSLAQVREHAKGEGIAQSSGEATRGESSCLGRATPLLTLTLFSVTCDGQRPPWHWHRHYPRPRNPEPD